MAKSVITTLRLDQNLTAWVTAYVEEHGVTKTDVIRDLFVALRDRRFVMAQAPIPDLIYDGSHPEFPVPVCRNLQ